jgi:hypothetical protein
LALEARLILPDDDAPIQEHWVRLRALSRDGRWYVVDDDDLSLVSTWAARLFRTLLSVQSLRMGIPSCPERGDRPSVRDRIPASLADASFPRTCLSGCGGLIMMAAFDIPHRS